MEIAFIHTQILVVLWHQGMLSSKDIATQEEIGGLLMEKTELMVKTMIKATEDQALREKILQKGIYETIRPNLTNGHEKRIQEYKN